MASLTTIFNDPVHGTIEIHPLCMKIIDTPEFQRLRNIRQCGICYLVYPSAIHTRFEHSIGVYHLAGVMLDHLKRKDTLITDEESLCVKIAALCHDLGHGPFSHLWEQFVKKQNNNNKEWHHEDMSLRIFEHLVESNNLIGDFKKYNLQDEHLNQIKHIISGNYELIEKEKLFLFEIVANKKTNIDVDRWDYMLRDAYFFGVVCPINYPRIVANVRVEQTENGEHRIAFRDKLRENILEIFSFRMKLHKICYKHRVCKKLEIMLLDALKAADDDFFENGLKLSNCHEMSFEKFLTLNDGLMNFLACSENNKTDAKVILNRILKRDLYPDLISVKLPNSTSLNAISSLEDRLDHIEEYIKKEFSVVVRLGLVDINMGIKGNDPFKDVIFFKKSVQDVKNSKDEPIYDRQLYLHAFSVNPILEEDKKSQIKRLIEEEINNCLALE